VHPSIYFAVVELFALFVALRTLFFPPPFFEIIFVENRPYAKRPFMLLFFGLLGLINFIGFDVSVSFGMGVQVWVCAGLDGLFFILLYRNEIRPVAIKSQRVNASIER
jgi:hypothetical protein